MPKSDIAYFEETNFPLILNFLEAAFFRFDYLPITWIGGLGTYLQDQYFKTFYFLYSNVKG